MQCLLCCQVESFIGLGRCNHQPFCYKCVYKMRVVTQDYSCPVCKDRLEDLIITSRGQRAFSQLRKEKLLENKNFPNIFFESAEAKGAFERLTQYRCFVSKCEQTKGFPSIAFLKKHLKEKHNRFMCDICVDNKRCVLEEHRLYSYKALDNHQRSGDVDQFGNLIFLHPYCSFCKEYYFDQEGLKKHLGKDHYFCNSCPDTIKYTFYKDYKSLETHFKMTHFICPEPDCVAKGFIVFKTNTDLMAHKYVEHDKNPTGQKRSKDLTAISGFYTEGTKQEESKIKFHDKEGVNFEDEFLSLKKIKFRGFHQVDEHKDGEFDFRPFYKKSFQEDVLFEQAFEGAVKRDNPKKDKGKGKYRQKGFDPIEQAGEKTKPGAELLLEDLQLVKTANLPAIEYGEFEKKLLNQFSQGDSEKFSEIRHGYNKKKISARDFLDGFLKLFPSKRTGFNVWQQYIRTLQNQAAREELDEAYLQKVKRLPRRVANLVNSCEKYSDFMRSLTEKVEANLQERISNGTLNIRKKVRVQKTRIFQTIQIVRHMSTIDMIKIKHSANHGIMPDTAHFITQEVFMSPIDKVQSQLHKIAEHEFLSFYVYCRVCRDALSGKKIHLEMKLIKEDILEEFLEKRPALQVSYGKRKQSMTLEEQAQFQDAEEKRNFQKLQQRTFTKSNVLIDTSDKYEFPELIQSKNQEGEKKHDPKANITNEQYRQTIIYETKKPATRLKNLNEYFPTIGEDNRKAKKTEKPSDKVSDPPPEKPEEKPWWYKVSGKVQEAVVEEGKVSGEIGRKKKRGREVIEIQGGFR